MKIGELSQKTHIPVETIRYYEKLGLIQKAHRQLSSNYREYSDAQLTDLIFIKRCRALDMTLNEIQELLLARNQDTDSCEAINTVLKNHLSHVQNRIKELKKLEKELKEINQHCLTAKLTSECGILKELKDVIDTDHHESIKNHIPGSHHSIRTE